MASKLSAFAHCILSTVTLTLMELSNAPCMYIVTPLVVPTKSRSFTLKFALKLYKRTIFDIFSLCI